VEAAATGKFKRRLGDPAAGGNDLGVGVREVVGVNDQQRAALDDRQALGKAATDAAIMEAGVLRAVVFKFPIKTVE